MSRQSRRPAAGEARPPRIVTVCVRGRKSVNDRTNNRSMQLLGEVVETLTSRPEWHPIDAVLLPGGFVRLHENLGPLPFAKRAAAILATRQGRCCQQSAEALAQEIPDVALVMGIDTDPVGNMTCQDEMCVAFQNDAIIGIGRQVFPSHGKQIARDAPLICFAEDFGSPTRVIALANGSRAMLCASYDVFGLPEPLIASTACVRNIRALIVEGQRINYGDAGFHSARVQALSDWTDLVLLRGVSVALAALQPLSWPGMDTSWQRHGIASASAAIGGLCAGAAHVWSALPGQGSPAPGDLASYNVPQSHLLSAQRRRAHRHSPAAGITLWIEGDRQPGLLLRLYEGAPSNGR